MKHIKNLAYTLFVVYDYGIFTPTYIMSSNCIPWHILYIDGYPYVSNVIVFSKSLLTHAPFSVMHVMMTSSNGNISRVTGHLCGEFTGHRFPLIYARLNGWVNNGGVVIWVRSQESFIRS